MKAIFQFAMVLGLLLMLAAPALSTTYYVSEDAAGGGDGSEGTPWQTILTAVQSCDGATPIVIYVKAAVDGVHNEAAQVLTDASCAAKDVTIEGYTTTPGDGTVGSTVVQIASGDLEGIKFAHATGSFTFRYLDLVNTECDAVGDDTLLNPQTNQISTTFDKCILRRSAEQSTIGKPIITYQSGIVPTRTFTMTDSQVIDYSAGAHTTGMFVLGEWAQVTIDGCSFSGSPAGGIAYAFQFIYTVPKIVITDCTSTLTHANDSSQAFVIFSNAIDNGIVSILMDGCTLADTALIFGDTDDAAPIDITVSNCTIVASGRAISVGLGSGRPTTDYGTTRIMRNHITLTHETTDHGVAPMKGVANAIVEGNTIIAGAGFLWPVICKADRLSLNHNVVVHQSRIICVAGTGDITNNTFVQTADNNIPCLDLYSNSGGPEDVWPEYYRITNNIIDASSGSECIRIYDDSGAFNPTIATYQCIFDNNIYVAGADGMATIWGTDCVDLEDMQDAWETHSASGAPRYNDQNSSEETGVGFWNASANDFRLFRNSPAFSNDPNDFYITKGAWNRASNGNSRWWQYRRLGE